MPDNPVPFAPRDIAVLRWLAAHVPPGVAPDDTIDVDVNEHAVAPKLGLTVKTLRHTILRLQRLGVLARSGVRRGVRGLGVDRVVSVRASHPVWVWLRTYELLCAQARQLGDPPPAPPRTVGVPKSELEAVGVAS